MVPFTMRQILQEWRNFTGDTKASLDGHPLNLKVLRRPDEHQEGFMNKPEPDGSFGLYFVYPKAQLLGFWMKNVPFDLDLVALDNDLRVVQILHLRANDETTRMISFPCKHVLELRSGWCKDHKVGVGSELLSQL